jgi:hypothetical protein
LPCLAFRHDARRRKRLGVRCPCLYAFARGREGRYATMAGRAAMNVDDLEVFVGETTCPAGRKGY